MDGHLIEPYGGQLLDLMVSGEEADDLSSRASSAPFWDLTPRQICDLELLFNGSFSPLSGFMGSGDYDPVVSEMRLADGTLWPIPITLDVPEEVAGDLSEGDLLGLKDPEGFTLALVEVSDVFRPDRGAEAEAVYGTSDPDHPGVAQILDEMTTPPMAVGGRVRGLRPPAHYDFRDLRMSPSQLRDEFTRLGWKRVVAFQTRNPMHRAHQELTLRAAKEVEASLLIHPVVGMTKPGDVDHYTRVRCYTELMKRYPTHTAKVSLLPLAMRMAGPREAIWHAIIRRNHGCTHLIVGRDHAGPGARADGTPFYGPYDAQEMLAKHEDEVGVAMVPFRQMVYVEDLDAYMPEDEVPEGARVLSISGTELRRRLAEGREIPEWFTFPEVGRELRRTYRPNHKRGFTVFLTGLPASGKSTTANVLMVLLMEMGDRPVTLLDGDLVRKHLSSELGFSKEHRNLNITRIGYVASEITKNGGIAICAPIAPYDAVRQEVRRMVEEAGGFILVHVNTPLEVCEERDPKGLYAKARRGEIEEFTGISDPYEPPADADITVDASEVTPEESAQMILLHLESKGYFGDPVPAEREA